MGGMTKSRIFLYFCLFFICGIFLNSFFNVSQPLILGFLILGLILISVLWNYRIIAVLGFCFIFLAGGICWYQRVEFESKDNKLKDLNDKQEEIILIGIVSEEPDLKENNTKLTVDNIEIGYEEIEGKILITARKYPEYQYGDKLKITGLLKTPATFEDFNYQNYLAKDEIYSVMNWPEIELIGKNEGNILSESLFSLKKKLKESLNRTMSPPQSGVLEALFFGDEENIPQNLKDKFNITGIRHITAVSGMNITIISALILNFLLFLGLNRRQAFYYSLILIFLYILMIGAPASAQRAGIMGCLFLTAQYFGRLAAASRLIIFAATFMLLLNPLLLKLDVGFQLSFLSMLGLVYLQPILSDFFRKIPNIFQLRYTLAATFSAQIFTLPILVFNFGRMSLVGPLINILVIPTLSFITILGFIFSILGIFLRPLGWFLSLPVWLFLTYIIKIVDYFSQFSLAAVTFENVSGVWLMVFYLFLGYIAWRLQEKQKLKFLQY